MLGVRHTEPIAWRRKHATRHYLGYVLIADDAVRLAGREEDTDIYAVLSIPRGAILEARVGTTFGEEEVVGEPAVVLELADNDPIYLRPLSTGPLGVSDLVRKIQSATYSRNASSV